ncbi:MAG: type I-D CRISPR-associated protein Cas7/Csc2 [Microcoleus sp. PH2017_10_PVI_O_A]|uniref:type I-D CRISPR-associated protein Cas7/Csc2 n=1 Tax=unclassified Microcoleus TaxID=2642155 RepID=UPI001D43913C|nr:MULTISPECIES: type I-D CRISPR-associated protein Cas7/Csc2 [unclassified Microcoleus]TAE79726.1 MAG: type I-D CRISPR-associated protein Cas7/Csc2 [Oscillatoriales cyanobacterium]MCC3407541.1 type I-D CRISPR-associated protein Cas7/Csc2 [Microcoleus sp. PH2017_10_PVI_O_A]MCC3460170.1 type I-D CRISPR-associated protein Cas7/Csc2 [Microcoleus sp. PH2017_11_PCY_U_A]MCC3480100.1 type I-D CRISPR-associated protein Cas7/Csc2 [Microcoleus sp. PH2017_12_PCY_D_A]MCC3559478.1 type I-D CRISPR-associate
MSIAQLQPFLAPSYENFPKGRTIGVVVLRTTQSETIFRTEGTGEPMCSEYVQAGIEDTESIPRLVMTKRKQIAPERRKGREFLRSHNLLYPAPKTNEICALNTNAPCEMCVDCFLYGFAAGGEGAQKSRVWTEDAFSVLHSTELIGDRTINAIFETGTMRDEKGNASTALNTSEYIKPGVHFLDIVTLKDVTADELRYTLGNILLTTRYGAVSSRVGRMDNQILGVFGGIAELPSSLELVQGVYDKLKAKNTAIEHPFKTQYLVDATQEIISTWTNKRGISMQLSATECDALIADVDRHWSLPEQETFLKRLDESYAPWRKVKSENKKKGKNKD